MKKEKLVSEPAFGNISQSNEKEYPGMSKRFYAACAAMQGILSNPTNGIMLENRGVVRQSYLLADELLIQENE